MVFAFGVHCFPAVFGSLSVRQPVARSHAVAFTTGSRRWFQNEAGPIWSSSISYSYNSSDQSVQPVPSFASLPFDMQGPSAGDPGVATTSAADDKPPRPTRAL